MKRSKASKKSIAEKALRQAIAEETSQLQGDLRAANATISQLHAVLRNISIMAHNAQGAAQAQTIAPLPLVVEAPIPSGPSTDLSDEDNMGDGRWV